MAVRIIEGKVKTVGGSFVGLMPTPFTSQAALTPTSSPQQSEAFAADTNSVTIDPDEDVHVNFGANPSVTTNDFKVLAGAPRDFLVTAGHKVAVRIA